MKVYLVEDAENAPGRILAVFHYKDDAFLFSDSQRGNCNVIERTLFEGQPPFQGYNP